MPLYDRLRAKWSGEGFHGYYVHHGEDAYDGQVTPWPYGQPPFTHTKLCLDVSKDRYVALEDLPISDVAEPAVVEKWHPLDIYSVDVTRMPILNGTIPRDPLYGLREYTNFPVYDMVNPIIPNQGLISAYNSAPWEVEDPSTWVHNPYTPWTNHLDVSSQYEAVQTVLARCNPTRAVLDIPAEATETVFSLAELVLLRGKSLSGTAGHINLSYQFGWKPLISDLKTVGHLAQLIDKRINTLSKLRSGRQSAKGTVMKHSEQEDSTFTVGLGPDVGGFYSINYKLHRETKVDRWGCVEYMAPSSFITYLHNLTPKQLREEAIKQLTAAEWWTNPSGWWEVTPFSWLADWFFEVQDLLRRYSTVELHPWRYCVMTRTTTTVKAEAVSIDSFYEGVDINLDDLTFEATITSQQRYVGDDDLSLPSISGTMPTFTDRQAGILASLFAIYKDIGKKVSVLGSLRRL
jgi:hypothetical protein